MRKSLLVILLAILAVPAFPRDFAKMSQEELAMKDNPLSPGDHAMILEREIRSSDATGRDLYDEHYYRIKIFTEEGKKYADVEIPYWKKYFRINGVKARSIAPNGTVTEFNGETFDKLIYKGRRVKILAKTFTIPNVQVGGIIEYKYTVNRDYLYDGRWYLPEELFTRLAKFHLEYYPRQFNFYYLTLGIPADQQPKLSKRALVYEAKNIPAFRKEERMPPDNVLKPRVEYFYSEEPVELTPEVFWEKKSRDWASQVEKFVGRNGAVDSMAAQAVAGESTPEGKLRKLYARAQQIRNTSYEHEKSEQEIKQEKIKENKNAGDVLARGYGDSDDIRGAFVALARAAGFQAGFARVASRDEYGFVYGLLNDDQLNTHLVWVNTGGQEYLLDPGTPQCPFGLLPWEKTATSGLKLVGGKGEKFSTPRSRSEDAITERKADLKLDAEGSAAGTLLTTFRGQEALRLRIDALRKDATGKTKLLEEEIKAWLPSSATFEIVKAEGWDQTDQPLVVEARVSVPNLAVRAGKRLLLAKGVLQTTESHPFKASSRVHPVYFEYPFQEADEVTLSVPAGVRVESTVVPRKAETDFGMYQSFVQRRGEALWLGRKLQIDGIFFAKEFYPELRAFYDTVRIGDEDNLVMQYTATAAQSETK